ncbi:probable G-protein coupled receptor 139 [Narcine bancroftii]|uniref:probable G-protein coupled receptor 139 n=1 Tax=Narcine bancroftii TaxID=1343680 RepID=UPI00383117F9
MHARVTGLVFAIYYPVLAVLGIPGNLVTIVILSQEKCGLSKCITRYLLGMAVTDLLFLLMAVVLHRISMLYFPDLFLHTTPVCSARIVLILMARDSSVWLTVAFTFDRFIAICCPKLNTKYCNERVAAIAIGTVCALSCVKNIPWYFLYEPLYTINNVPWYCNIKLSFYSDLLWAILEWIDRILIPFAPFLLMLVLNALTVRHILLANRARRRLRPRSNRENQSDPEMSSRRKSIILLFTISGTFIVLWMAYFLNFLNVRIKSGNYSTGSANEPTFLFQEIGIMLQLLNCSTNTCTYAATQRKFREEFKRGLNYPLNLFINRVKS